MVTHQLKINFANLKHEIERNYFAYRDIFYKALIVNLCNHHAVCKPIAESTVLEDFQYNQSFQQLIQSSHTLRDLVLQVTNLTHPSVVIDMEIYVDEFLQARHNSKRINVYSLTIDDCYNVIITNKQLLPVIVKTGEPRNEAL